MPITFDKHGWMSGKIPRRCVEDCAASGQVYDSVHYWRDKLDFNVPRDQAIAYLKPYGAWDSEELAALTDEELAEKVLWLACGDIKEQGEWLGLVH